MSDWSAASARSDRSVGSLLRAARLAIPATLMLSTLGLGWAVAGGLTSCDSTARFSLVDIKFDRVHVVSTFPAKVDKAAGKIIRACGAPIVDPDSGQPYPGQTSVVANGFEFNVNLVSNDLSAVNPACKGDKDLQIRDGERVEQQLVTTSAEFGSTVAPQMFKLQAQCIEPRVGIGDPTGCKTSMNQVTSTAAAVNFKQNSRRCNPQATETWQNVVILVDHSGSTSGQVVINTQSCLDATKFAEDLPANTKAPEQFGKCSSDKYFIRVQAAQLLIDQLNPQDRVMTMLFDENEGVKVGCTDSARCRRDDGTGAFEEQPSMKGKVCYSDENCDVKNNFRCDPTLSSAVPDGYDLLDAPTAMKKCFGSSSEKKSHNRFGIDARARYNGVGRAPMLEAVDTAYKFLKTMVSAPDPQKGGNAKHIVLITDGPDTCTKSESFHFSDPKSEFEGKVGQCRSECTTATTHYKELLAEMAKAGFPVKVHVIQLQSKGQTDPDPMLMELACRSDGTYQFLNQVEFVQDDPDEFYKAIGTAVSGVRHALGGSWRVGVLDNRIAIGDPGSPMPVGTTMAMRGDLRFTNPLFASLAGTFIPPQGSVDWNPDFQFQQSGSNALRDRRLMFNVACSASSECGGGEACAPNHCAMGGTCKSANAPDLLRCGDNDGQFCCGGTCSATCASCSK
ncbi:MAG: hypothetical protein HY902_10645 [Deltaproteobacteria bacterium]|nr:hypothetical protein [Deltaproteobacteria bacterium]